MPLGEAVHCAGCGVSLSDYHGQQHPGEIYCHSQIYGSGGVIICKRCGRDEDAAIEEKNTNDVPELLNLYRRKHHE